MRVTFTNGNIIDVIESENSIRGKRSKPSMWCSKCECWTKEYSIIGSHVCGTEVVSSSLNSGFPDIDYEGKAIES